MIEYGDRPPADDEKEEDNRQKDHHKHLGPLPWTTTVVGKDFSRDHKERDL